MAIKYNWCHGDLVFLGFHYGPGMYCCQNNQFSKNPLLNGIQGIENANSSPKTQLDFCKENSESFVLLHDVWLVAVNTNHDTETLWKILGGE